MQNEELARDYLKRGAIRLKALKTLLDEEGWADVVREAQEIVELVLKGFLRANNIMPPRVHDVSPVIEENLSRFDKKQHKVLKEFIEQSRKLRRDRELAFYGSEDLTPSGFYRQSDATEAFAIADTMVKTVKGWLNF